MTRDEILQAINDQGAELNAMLADLPADAFARPVIEWWTLKDLLGHMTMWRQVAIQFIAEYKRAGAPTPLGLAGDAAVDAYNKRGVAARRDLPLARVRAEFDAAHRDLVAAIATLSDADLTQPLPAPWNEGATLERLIAINSYQHDPEHIAQIAQLKLRAANG